MGARDALKQGEKKKGGAHSRLDTKKKKKEVCPLSSGYD